MNDSEISSRSWWALEWRLAAIQNGMRDAIAYRLEFLLEIVGSAAVPVILQLVLWYSIFKTSGATQFAGMTYQELISYTWMTLLFSQIRGGDLDFSLIEMIRTGTLNNYLLRPVGVIQFIYMRGLGERILIVTLCLGLGILSTAFSSVSPFQLILGMLLALVGNVIAFMIGAALSSVAFYWENAFAALMVKNMIVSLLSGELLPLTLIPHQYSWIWKATPFYLFVFGPTQVALGKWSASEWAVQMGIGLAWIIGLSLVIKLLWGISMKRYQGLGG